MSRMECGEDADLLLEFAAGRLDAGTRVRCESHMEVCPACREFVRSRRIVWQSLDAWEAPPISADFDRRLYASIEREVAWWARALLPLRAVLVRRWLPIAAAAGFILIAGIAVDRSTTVRKAPEKATVQLESLRPDQADNALQDLEMLQEISGPGSPDSGSSTL
jgi:anti-sigma factor RsiW